MAILHGKDLMILDSSSNALVAMSKSCEIDIEADEIEVSSATAADWRTFIAGRKSWQVTVNFLVTAGNMSTDIAKVGTTVTLKMKDGTSGTALTGSAIVRTYRITGTVGNLAQGTFQFRGVSSLAT